MLINLRKGVIEKLFDIEYDELSDKLSMYKPRYIQKNYDKKTLRAMADSKLPKDEAKEMSDIPASEEKIRSTMDFLNSLKKEEKLIEIDKILDEISPQEGKRSSDKHAKKIRYISKRISVLGETGENRKKKGNEAFGQFCKKVKQAGKDWSTANLSKDVIDYVAEAKDAEKLIDNFKKYDYATVTAFADIDSSYIKYYFHFKEGKRYNNEYYYGDSVGNYIKAIIEEYTSLPFPEREMIYMNEKLKGNKGDLNDISDILGHECTVTLKTSGSDTKENFEFKAISIETDLDGKYNYLVGSKKSGRKWIPVSFRLGRIEKINKHGEFDVEKEKARDDWEKVSVYEPEYIASGESEIRVLLTEKGERLYKQVILNMRPLYEKRESVNKEDYVAKYTFMCSEYRAEKYFLRFGKEALIVYPEKLAKKMQKIFKEANEKISSEKSTELIHEEAEKI